MRLVFACTLGKHIDKRQAFLMKKIKLELYYNMLCGISHHFRKKNQNDRKISINEYNFCLR